MVLRNHVTSADGRLMLAAGTALTPNHVRLLEQRGIASIDVVDESAAATDGRAVKSEEHLCEWFALHSDAHPLSRELMRMFRKRNGIREA